jgi:predicted RNA binding protein YcfA (HicA-like mRNA interferase family)
MKLPRDVSGARLIRALQGFGYEVIRRKGSHVRLRHTGPPQHLVTVPDHDAIKTGTLQAILAEVARERLIPIEDLKKDL